MIVEWPKTWSFQAGRGDGRHRGKRELGEWKTNWWELVHRPFYYCTVLCFNFFVQLVFYCTVDRKCSFNKVETIHMFKNAILSLPITLHLHLLTMLRILLMCQCVLPITIKSCYKIYRVQYSTQLSTSSTSCHSTIL